MNSAWIISVSVWVTIGGLYGLDSGRHAARGQLAKKHRVPTGKEYRDNVPLHMAIGITIGPLILMVMSLVGSTKVSRRTAGRQRQKTAVNK